MIRANPQGIRGAQDRANNMKANREKRLQCTAVSRPASSRSNRQPWGKFQTPTGTRAQAQEGSGESSGGSSVFYAGGFETLLQPPLHFSGRVSGACWMRRGPVERGFPWGAHGLTRARPFEKNGRCRRGKPLLHS